MAGHGVHVVVKGCGVSPADVGDAALAESGEDALRDDLLVESGGARLQVAGGVLVKEPPAGAASLERLPRGR